MAGDAATAPGGAAAMGGARASTDMPRIASDLHRNTVALTSALIGTVVVFVCFWIFLPLQFNVDWVVTIAFVFWILYTLSTAAFTQIAYRRADGETLKRWLLATNPTKRSEIVAATISGSGIGVNVTWGILAVVTVGLMVGVPGLIESPLANGLGIGVVLSSWVVTVYAYATHYARLNSLHDCLQFPVKDGETSSPVYMDYLYLSAQVATTFSSSDVTIMTTRARQVVTGQTLIAFAYTSFIIAMVIGLLFR